MTTTKFKTEYRKKIISPDFIGMNFEAHRELHKAHLVVEPWHHKHNTTIEIFENQSPLHIKETEKHEEIEFNLMKNKNMHYRQAHRWATNYEKRKESIKTLLKEINTKLNKEKKYR